MTDGSGTGVTITVRDVYDQVMLLTGLITPLADPQTGVVAELKDHEARLRALERNRWPLPSLAVLISATSLAIMIFVR